MPKPSITTVEQAERLIVYLRRAAYYGDKALVMLRYPDQNLDPTNCVREAWRAAEIALRLQGCAFDETEHGDPLDWVWVNEQVNT